MRNLIAALAILIALVAIPTYAQNTRPALFNTEQQSPQHCPADTVVWLNLPTGVYHFQGER